MNFLNRCKPLLGTYVEVNLYGDFTDDQLLELSTVVFTEIEKVDAAMSFHNPDSELSHINHNAYLQRCDLSKGMTEVLEQALKLSRLTQGLFDISVAPALVSQRLLPDPKIEVNESASWKNIHLQPGSVKFSDKLLIDLGGIAKGYAVDQGFKALESYNIQAIINAGGDLRMTDWKNQTVSIRHPSKPSVFMDIPMRAEAVATSASYFIDNGSAMILPAMKANTTAQPRAFNQSVSVFGNSCMLADALTKIVALGFSNNELFLSLGAEVLTIDGSEKFALS